ncbi:MAG TPA: phytanoyl-CoA dioxygenase family protein [Caulobacteraceae bacterium]|nr:phytanoyl-CoA dioxygenase family protein [Caulobacteraceae bacterium]
MDDASCLERATASVSSRSGGSSRFGLPISPEALELWDEIERLDLVRNIAELEVLGWTVIPPEQAAPPGFCERLRDKILEVAARRDGRPADREAGATHTRTHRPIGGLYTYLLFEDPIFQEAMCNEVGMALTTYLLGRNAIASNCIGGLKGPGEADLGLHCDNALMVAPFPPIPQVCNITYALTDYSRENGALCFVPGSHKYLRHPAPGEGLDQRVPVECRAGSIIFWGGNAWHGAFARTAPGLRINLIMAMMRSHMRPQEPYRETVTQAILDANPPRFATLMGQHLNYGWKEEGPQNEATAYNVSRHAYD